jgi:hypothetical protein
MKIAIIDCTNGNVDERQMTEQEANDHQASQIQASWDALRSHRDALLAASDWTVLSDSPTSTAAWKTYRQALRDLPANTTDPSNPVWPTPPA